MEVRKWGGDLISTMELMYADGDGDSIVCWLHQIYCPLNYPYAAGG